MLFRSLILSLVKQKVLNAVCVQDEKNSVLPPDIQRGRCRSLCTLPAQKCRFSVTGETRSAPTEHILRAATPRLLRRGQAKDLHRSSSLCRLPVRLLFLFIVFVYLLQNPFLLVRPLHCIHIITHGLSRVNGNDIL